jgi:hypothetical protein
MSFTIRLRQVAMATALVLGAATAHAAQPMSPFTLKLSPIGTYASGVFDASAAEIVAHDARSQRLFVVNAANGLIDVLDIQDPTQPMKLFSIDLSDYGADVNSVAVNRGLVVAVVQNVVRTDPGQAVFMTIDGSVLAAVEVGALPDMVTFTPDGRTVLVANEGEPNADYSVDPEGSVSIIDLPRIVRRLTQDHVRTASFAKFNGMALDPSIRITGPGATVAQDLEPEYVTVSNDGKTAFVALQENNALAVLDIEAGEFTSLRGMGFKDHMLPGNGMDVSDQNPEIRIANWPVFGVHMPDAIASYEVRGSTYIVTANEGDAREYEGYADVRRFRSLSGDIPICPDSARFNQFFADNPFGIEDLAQLRDNQNLGRLNIVTTEGLSADGSCYEALYAFGARSFSIYNADLQQVYDSGSDFERITAEANPAFFNSNHSENTFKTRSDDKGPEPEGVTVAKLFGATYAFIGLERVGGVMVYDVTDPYAPSFVQYINNRDFTVAPGMPESGDQGAEGLIVIDAARSPIRGVPLLVVANEVSGTTTLFRIDRERRAGER